jgi:EmrB/QacA subfamily drug resistance transporter
MVSAMAVVGDIIPPSRRGRYQGLFGAVFAFATVVGPLLGGLFVEHLSWRWIFYVNVPIGVVAVAVIAATLPARQERTRHAIDYLGAVLLAGSLSAIILFTSLGGTTYPWASAPMLLVISLAAVLAAALVVVERRASEPIVPLELFRNRTFSVASAIGFVIGLALFGSVTFLPLYYQVVKGNSPTVAGLQIVPLMGGLLVTSIASGRLTSRLGRYRMFPIAGTAITTLALALLSTIGTSTSPGLLALYMATLGAGLGMVMQVLVLAVQNAVDYRFLGVATSGATLFRQIGGSIGVSIFGAIFANQLAGHLAERLPAASVPRTTDPAHIAALPASVHGPYVEAYAVSLDPVFLVAAGIAAAAFALSLLLPDVPLRHTTRTESPARPGTATASADRAGS